MNIKNEIKKIYNSIFDIPNIPQEVKDSREPILLHISDTPVSFHDFIFKVIEEVKPNYLIHTGDLVDNIKMESNPQLINFYVKRVAGFINELESFPLEKIYVVPGNHDDIETIERYRKKLILVEEGINIKLENIIINVAHHPWKLGNNAQYYLYGHNFDSIPQIEGQVFLNGLNKMHVILLHSNRVIPIDYPYGIDQDRKMYSHPRMYKGGK